MNFKELTIDQIIEQLPEATKVFRENKLVFCCGTGGNLKLPIACSEANANYEKIEQELGELIAKDKISQNAKPNEIITSICKLNQKELSQRLPELLFLSNKVEKVHRDSPDCPAGLAVLLEKLTSDLTVHIQYEKNIIEKNDRNEIQKAKQNLETIQLTLSNVLKKTNNGIPPLHACNSWRALYGGISNLNQEIKSNVNLEISAFNQL